MTTHHTPEHRYAEQLRDLASVLDGAALEDADARASLAVALRNDASRLDGRGDRRTRLMAEHTAALQGLIESTARLLGEPPPPFIVAAMDQLSAHGDRLAALAAPLTDEDPKP